MNSSSFEKINKSICNAAQVTLSALKPRVFFEWRVEVYEKDDDHLSDNGYLCGAPWPKDGTSRSLLTRCKIAVKHGLGFSSGVDLEAYQSSANENEHLHISPDVEIPSDPGTGTAACITLQYDIVPQFFVYVSITSCDSDLVQNSLAEFIGELDERISALGTRWMIGGTLPKNYFRLGDPGPCYSCA